MTDCIAMEEEYKVIRQIGKGAFGRVLLVESGDLRENFVIKQVNTANMSQNEREKVIYNLFLIRFADNKLRRSSEK